MERYKRVFKEDISITLSINERRSLSNFLSELIDKNKYDKVINYMNLHNPGFYSDLKSILNKL